MGAWGSHPLFRGPWGHGGLGGPVKPLGPEGSGTNTDRVRRHFAKVRVIGGWHSWSSERSGAEPLLEVLNRNFGFVAVPGF